MLHGADQHQGTAAGDQGCMSHLRSDCLLGTDRLHMWGDIEQHEGTTAGDQGGV